MTQQEFTKRTGISLSESEFEYVHRVYMNTDMDKDDFCKDYKKHASSRIIIDLHANLVKLQKQIQERTNAHQATLDLCSEVADFFLVKAADYDNSEFRSMALRILGKESEVVKATMRLGLPLRAEDLEYIKNNLQ